MTDMNELTAGQMLRQARTTGRRKRELGTIARTLCIREEYLESLENDDFTKIPELVYILGFARNYAIELELDPYIVVDKIKKQMGLKEEQNEVEVEGEEPTGILDIAPRPSKFIEFMEKNSRNILILLAVLVGVSVIGLVVANIASQSTSGSEVTEIQPAKKYNLPIAQEFGVRNRDYATIVLQATDTTWLQVKNATGTVVFEHSMVAGDVYYALNGTTATIGNAGALDVWVNGKITQKLGAPHQRVADVVLSPENLMK